MNNIQTTESKLGGNMGTPSEGYYLGPQEVEKWVDAQFGTLTAPKIGPKQTAAYNEIKVAFAKAFKLAASKVPGGICLRSINENVSELVASVRYSLTFGGKGHGTA